MTIEYGVEPTAQDQQQQGDDRDLSRRYRKIGIPAVSAAAMLTPQKKRTQQQQAAIFDYED